MREPNQLLQVRLSLSFKKAMLAGILSLRTSPGRAQQPHFVMPQKASMTVNCLAKDIRAPLAYQLILPVHACNHINHKPITAHTSMAGHTRASTPTTFCADIDGNVHVNAERPAKRQKTSTCNGKSFTLAQDSACTPLTSSSRDSHS